MSLLALAIASVLFGIGTYLVLQRLLSRVIIGLTLISNGVNVLILLAAGPAGDPPLVGDDVDPATLADPLPQALVLTAIVITFGVTALLLALALRSYVLTGSDAVEDDLEDRRIARETHVEEPERPDTDMHEAAP